ncbi:MAG: alpha/beta fold hydrolase, partial [Actinobacteria bacterium]|nr:alpha/beta fold hydrolase [Actinomycetota bacterium]
MSGPADIPVVLVHGWAGSFRETWQSTGMDALLEDGGRSVIGVDLLGHGNAEKPHDP